MTIKTHCCDPQIINHYQQSGQITTTNSWQNTYDNTGFGVSISFNPTQIRFIIPCIKCIADGLTIQVVWDPPQSPPLQNPYIGEIKMTFDCCDPGKVTSLQYDDPAILPQFFGPPFTSGTTPSLPYGITEATELECERICSSCSPCVNLVLENQEITQLQKCYKLEYKQCCDDDHFKTFTPPIDNNNLADWSSTDLSQNSPHLIGETFIFPCINCKTWRTDTTK
jgi:hypothetical protein